MIVQTIVDFIVDTLFPKRCPWCGAVVGFSIGCPCDKPREEIRLPARPITDFTIEPWNLLAVYAVYPYEYPARNAILRMKFQGERELEKTLGEAMARQFAESGLAGRYDILAPAPVSAKTLKKRGYYQSALLAGVLSRKTKLPWDDTLLKKTRETAPQRTLARQERLTNVKEAYEADRRVAGKRVLLVDDIVTTGSTLNECAAALLKAGAAECAALCLAATGHGSDADDEI